MAMAILCACIASCKKDAGNLPHIAFMTGSGYTSADASVDTNTVVHFGIACSKAEDKDVLRTFDASRVYDGGSSVSIENATLTGTQGDTYNAYINIKTRAVAGTEKYTFTVVNRDGLKNSVSLTLTVHY